MNRLWVIFKDVFLLIGQEFKAIFTNYKKVIPFIVILFIPLLYAGMFLWAFWDPYGKTEELSVAIVNLDSGTTIDKKELNVGKEFVKTLKKDHTFNWKFLSKSEAKRQLKDEKIYMYIEIPANFSKDASSLLSDKIKKPHLYYVSNQGMNYIVSKINDTAVNKITTKLSNKLTETYAESMFTSFTKVSDGLQEASDGSNKIGDGLNKVLDGITKMKNGMKDKQDSISSLSKGMNQLNEGLLSSQNGTNQLIEGTKKLQDGANQTKDGSQKLSDGLDMFSTNMSKLTNGASALPNASTQLSQMLNLFLQKHPEYQTDRDYQTILALNNGISSGIQTIVPSLNRLNKASKELTTHSYALATGQTKLATSFTPLLRGEMALNKGIQQLTKGSERLSNGSNDIEKGWNSLIDNLEKLRKGQVELTDGNEKLTNSLNDAHKKTNDIHGSDDIYDMFSKPITLTKEVHHEIPNYGTALSPYFLSMGLFVGMFVTTVIFPFKESAGRPKSGFSWYVSKTCVILFISFFQTLILDIAVIKGLGLDVEDIYAFFWFMLLSSITFSFIIQFLVTSMSNVGRFLTIVFMVIQLTSSGGTFPIELIPPKLQSFYDSLPMSHSISGLKSLISLHDNKLLHDSLPVLFTYLVISAILSLFTFVWFHKKEK